MDYSQSKGTCIQTLLHTVLFNKYYIAANYSNCMFLDCRRETVLLIIRSKKNPKFNWNYSV